MLELINTAEKHKKWPSLLRATLIKQYKTKKGFHENFKQYKVLEVKYICTYFFIVTISEIKMDLNIIYRQKELQIN